MKLERQIVELTRFLENAEEFLGRQVENAEPGDRQKMEEYFPNLLRSSLFVTIYSVVENELNKICRQLAAKDGLDVEDLRGNGIQRACTFLTRVCRVDFPDKSDEWKLLRNYNQLRNVIVHNQGYMETGNSHLSTLVKESPSLQMENDGVIHLDRDFCPGVLETARDFFSQLQIALDEKNQ